MKWAKWLENWDMSSLKITAPFLEMEWIPKEADKDAAWEMYIELLTRTYTQRLDLEHGDEQTALNSIYELFQLTRNIIKNYKRDCFEFTKIAIVILNQKVRPFTVKWHKLSLDNAFSDKGKCVEFRDELFELQISINNYTKMLANMAGVEDLTMFEA